MIHSHDPNEPLPFSRPGLKNIQDTPSTPLPDIHGYVVLGELGEGGMGRVYLARETHTLQREVALKVIKPGMDSRQVVARFEAERQTLACLEHPHIARVYQAGTTRAGRPYFVMEYIQGISVTRYCDEHQLALNKRLHLFLQVCQAIQHAHTKGIIHRDIKPSNILVAVQNNEPCIKVIDFGVARALDRPVTDGTLHTEANQIIGTPEYMSPEQADRSRGNVDTRSDIYSLGTVLYELLTGMLPFSLEMLRKGDIDRIRHVICEEEPKTPSTRLSTVNGIESTRLARLRCTNTQTLHRQLRGDLDWITIKALEKEPARRYETVHALTADIHRHLAREPVSAVPPSRRYRLHRYLHRHRIQVMMAALVTILLVVTAVTGRLWQKYTFQQRAVESVLHRQTLTRARDCFVKREFQASLDLTNPILNSVHVGSEARLLYASLLIEGRYFEEAISRLQALTQQGGDIAGAAHALMVRLYWYSDLNPTEKKERVQVHRQQAQALLSDTAEAYYLRALTALTVQDTLSFLKRALYLDPSHYESRRLLTLTCQASHQYENMKENALAMMAAKPFDPLGYALHGSAWQGLERPDLALPDHTRALELAAQHSEDLEDLGPYLHAWYDAALWSGEYRALLDKAAQYRSVMSTDLTLRFQEFCAHVALGEYARAEQIYQETVAPHPTVRQRFDAWVRVYMFDALRAGRSWHPPGDRPTGPSYRLMYTAEQDYQYYRSQAECLITKGFSPAWSPDGNRIAFSLGTHGSSALAVMEVDTRAIRVLTVPGKDPSWSPDGRQIAFVRDRPLLSLSEVNASEKGYHPQPIAQEEVWIIQADGTEPRYMTQGSRPSWSAEGDTVYYFSRTDMTQYRVSLVGDDAQPEPVLSYYSCSYCFPSISPDDRFIAYVNHDHLMIIDMTSRELEQQWQGAPGIWDSCWTPDGRRLLLGSGDRVQARTGLWCYDLQEKRASKILDGTVAQASLVPGMDRLVFSLAAPLYEIWVTNGVTNHIDRLYQEGQRLEQHCQGLVDHYDCMSLQDPCDITSSERAQMYRQYLDRLNVSDEQGPEPHVSLLFGKPENPGPPLNTAYKEGMVSFASDNRQLYFVSDRPGGAGMHDLWFATRPSDSTPWSTPANLGPTVNSPAEDWWPCIAADGLTLYFFSEREGGKGGGDIWMTTRPSPQSPWSAPKNLDPPINGPHYDCAPCISSDGLELYFASSRQGGVDLWVSTRQDLRDPWPEPINLGAAVNSLQVDCCPALSRDGLTLFFNSTRTGEQDLYTTTRPNKGGPWQPAVNLGPKVNTACGEVCPSLSPDGRYLYFCDCPGTIMRPNGVGDADIWRVMIIDKTDRLSKYQ